MNQDADYIRSAQNRCDIVWPFLSVNHRLAWGNVSCSRLCSQDLRQQAFETGAAASSFVGGGEPAPIDTGTGGFKSASSRRPVLK